MKSVRIGAGLGFYGDSWRPVRVSIESGGVKYIASDHLAELTLAILQKDRQKDASAGYARDCVPMLTELWPLAAPRGVKFVMNAGGLNPHGAREAVARAFRDKGFKAAARHSPTWIPPQTSSRCASACCSPMRIWVLRPSPRRSAKALTSSSPA